MSGATRAPWSVALLPVLCFVVSAPAVGVLGGVGACRADPADKVVKWPRRWPAAASALDPDAADDLSPDAFVGPPLPEVPPRKPPCVEVVERACEALGRYSEECLEGRSALPAARHAELRIACAALLERHFGDGPKRSRVHPCRLLERAKCATLGRHTQECKLIREDASRLRRKRLGEVCRGDLLMWEARRLFSDRVSGSGR